MGDERGLGRGSVGRNDKGRGRWDNGDATGGKEKALNKGRDEGTRGRIKRKLGEDVVIRSMDKSGREKEERGNKQEGEEGEG